MIEAGAKSGARPLLLNPTALPGSFPARAGEEGAQRLGAGNVRAPAALQTALTRHPRLALIVLCLALWLPGFFNLPPTDRDESRFAQATKQMLETGDFVRIMNGAEPRNRKPIGIYWLQAPFAAAARATGAAAQNPIWPYRIPSLLGGIAAVLATYSIGLTLLADRRAALLAAGMLASCVILTVEAHIAKTDAALLGATTIGMAVLARAWRAEPVSRAAAALFWVALGASVLIKGPVGPMVVGLTILTAGWRSKSWRWLATLRPSWGLPLLLAMVLPWFAAIGVATHGRFFSDAVGGDLGAKLAGGSESHGAPPGFHLLLLPVLAFPATIPVLLGLGAAWRARRESAVIFLLAWLIPAWIVFECVPTKLPHYTLPLYPALFLLAADGLCRQAAPPRLRVVAIVVTSLAALVITASAVAAPLLLHASWWLGLPAAGAVALVFGFAVTGRAAAAIPASVLMFAAVLQVELPSLTPLWLAPQLTAILRRAAPDIGSDGNGLVAAGYDEPSLMFLAGTCISFWPTGAAAARASAHRTAAAAIIAANEVPSFNTASARLGLTWQSIGHVDGLNTARGQAVGLEIFHLAAVRPPEKSR